jgi:carbonic anhydrase
MSDQPQKAKKTYVSIEKLFENNKEWAAKQVARNPDFFKELAHQQKPYIFWIGCSDARVPSNQIIKLEPGQVFVHRNIANVVTHTDLNCLSVLSYAVEVLKVKHVIVCGTPETSVIT